MLELAKIKGVGEGPKEDPRDFLGEQSKTSVRGDEEEAVNSLRGEDMVT